MTKKILILVIFAAGLSANAMGIGAEGGGGLPVGRIPADVNLTCKAELGLYFIKGDVKNYGIYNSQFIMKAKKGDSTTALAISHPFNFDPNEWKLDQVKSENVDAKLFEPYLKSNHVAEIEFKSIDYSKSKAATFLVWLGDDGPNEVFANRAINLNDPLIDLEVLHKVRLPNDYTSVSLHVTCKQNSK